MIELENLRRHLMSECQKYGKEAPHLRGMINAMLDTYKETKPEAPVILAELGKINKSNRGA